MFKILDPERRKNPPQNDDCSVKLLIGYRVFMVASQQGATSRLILSSSIKKKERLR